MNATNTPSVTSQLIVRHDGYSEGADPRSISTATLRAAGHEPGSLLHVIREKCLDCCCGQAGEVRRCTAHQCALWAYRLGSNPFLRGRDQCRQFRRKKPWRQPGKFRAKPPPRGHPRPQFIGGIIMAWQEHFEITSYMPAPPDGIARRIPRSP